MNNYSKSNIANKEGTKTVPSAVLRKCCACGKISDREDFIRILKEHSTGKIIINPNNFQFGRSTYLCKNSECLKIALKKKRFKNFNEETIEEIKKLSITD